MAKSTVLLCALATVAAALCSLTVSTLDVEENYYDVDYDSTQRTKRDTSEHIIWRDNRETAKLAGQNGTPTVKRVVHHGIYPSLEMEVPVDADGSSGKPTRSPRSVPEGDRQGTDGGDGKNRIPVRITYQAVYPPTIRNSTGSSPYLRARHPPSGSDANYYTRQRVRTPPPTGNSTQYRTLYFPGTGQDFAGDPSNKGRVRLVSAAYYNVNGSRDDLRSYSNPPVHLRRVSDNGPIRSRRNTVSSESEWMSSIRSEPNIASQSERLTSIRSRRNTVSSESERTSSIRSNRGTVSPISERMSSIRSEPNNVSPSERFTSIRSIRGTVSPISERMSSIRSEPNIVSPSERFTSIRSIRDTVSPVSEWMSSIRSEPNIVSPRERLTSIRSIRDAVSPISERMSSIRSIRDTVSPVSEWMSSIRRRRNILTPASDRRSSGDLPDVDAPSLNLALASVEIPRGSSSQGSGLQSEPDHEPELDYASELDRKRPHYRKGHDVQRFRERPSKFSDSSELGEEEFPAAKSRVSKFRRSKKHRKLPKKSRQPRKRRLKNSRKRQNGGSPPIDVRSPARRRRDVGSWNWLDGFFGYEGTPVVVQKCKSRPVDVGNGIDDDSKIDAGPVDCFILIQAPPRKVFCKPPRRYALGRCRPVL